MLSKQYLFGHKLDKMSSQKQNNSKLKPCTASQDLCPNIFLADLYRWFWTLFKLSENCQKHLSATQIKWNDFRWSYITIKVKTESFECFWTTQNYFESRNQKFQTRNGWILSEKVKKSSIFRFFKFQRPQTLLIMYNDHMSIE